jgi:ankyrin repeat protein
MGDSPTRHYREFAEAYKHDKLITHLNEAAGGFDKTLLKWLGARRKFLALPVDYEANINSGDLALHCAVMAEPKLETLKLISYLLERMPNSLELKSQQGHTPLSLAFSLGRIEVIKLLIDGGADQTVRDGDGTNILHLALVSAYSNSSKDKETLTKSLALIDKRLVRSLLSERSSSHQPGSLTPLARWLKNRNTDPEILTILLEFGKDTGNEHLELLDGSGDTPLHHVVRAGIVGCAEVIVKYRPDLLHHENSVGRTPYELAEDAFITSCVANEPEISGKGFCNLVNQSPSAFTMQSKDKQQEYAHHPKRMWRFFEKFAKENPSSGKRRLVSLLDANEVAKRLAGRHTGKTILSVDQEDDKRDVESAGGDLEDSVDEVSMWYKLGACESEGLGGMVVDRRRLKF